MLDSVSSSPVPVKSAVSQGTVYGLAIMFLIYINDIILDDILLPLHLFVNNYFYTELSSLKQSNIANLQSVLNSLA